MLMHHLTVREIPPAQPAIVQTPRLHVAIISDGNGRWATSRGLPRSAGHRAGAEAARRIIEAAPRFGIHTLTLFALSSANWKRPTAEVHAILQLLHEYLQDRMDLGSGTLPIRGGKREKRQCVNAEAGRGFNDSPGSFGPGAMAGGARQTPRSGPAAIAVRDDGYV